MKKLNKWIAGLLCMMLVITMVAGLGVMEVKADDAVTTVSSWTELKNAISKGGNIQLGNDIVAETGNSAIYVSNTVTVDLAGHTIDRGCIKATWNGNTFTVSGGDLTIKDTSAAQAGQITGGYNDNNCGGGCIYVDSGILRLESGILTGNKCEDVDANGVDRGGAVGVRSGTFIMTGGKISNNEASYGAGVIVFSSGTFIMTGGKISNNEASYGAGVIVFSSGTFIMTGGEITDNTCDAGKNGAGMYVYEGPSLTIGGNAKIYGNRTADGKNSNLSVGNGESSSTIINLSTNSPLTSEAKICIRVSTDSNGKQITTSCKDLKDVFVSDNDSYEITTKDGEEGIFYTKKKSSGGSSTPSTPTSYNLRVGGVEVTSANTSGTGWSYDNQTNTLTLDGFNYEGNGSGIETSKDLNIIIKNENRIKNISSSYSDSTNGWSCGIYAFGNLTITGDGTLDVTGGTADTSHGISVLGKLEIDSQGTIIAKAQATIGTSGIFAYDGIVIKNGNITAYAAEAAYSSRGIECDGDITISGGTVVAKAEKGETFSYGLESDKKITISPNAVVTASGVTAALNKKPEGYTGEIGTTFVSNNTNPNPTPTPEPTPTPSEPSTTQGESTTTSTPASTSTVSTQGSQQVIPTIIEGAGSSYTQGSGNTIYFRSSDAFANFQKVMVDNAELSADCYTATEGSIIITLKPEYLSTLAAGSHSISIVSANGVATANFEVQTADTTAVSPKTGDNGQAALWITLLLLSCGALTAVGIRKKVR